MKIRSVTRRSFLIAGASATAGVAGFGRVRNARAKHLEAATDAPAFTAEGKSYNFDIGALRGTLRENGESQGFHPIQEVASGNVLSKVPGILTPYRLLASTARFLPDARGWTSRSKLLSDEAVEVHWSPDNEHPFELTAVYRLAAPNALDFRATVKSQRELQKFELFLASYFTGFSSSFVYVRNCPNAAGKPGFQEAVKQAGDWQMFPRDDGAANMITDGRWNYPPDPVDWKIMPRLAAPLALRRDRESGLTAVLMSPAKECFAVSTPYGDENHRSLYLSLFGCDLKAGETVSASARMIIGKNISNDQAINMYETYKKDQR